MKTAHVWLILSDAAQASVVESLTWDEETQGDYTGPLRNRSRRLFEYMQDNVTRRRLFSGANLAGTDYNLWALDFADEPTILQEVRDEIDFLIAQFPNQIAVGGAWKEDGAMFGCQLVLTEVPNPAYVGEPFMIPNPNYDPDPGTDENPNPNYDPREEIRNPAWVPETIIERSQTGTPTYPLPNYLWRFMPNPLPDGTVPASNADLQDINLIYGQAPRVFA